MKNQCLFDSYSRGFKHKKSDFLKSLLDLLFYEFFGSLHIFSG